MPESLKTGEAPLPHYAGNLYYEDLKYSLFEYQETGIRWIAAQMLQDGGSAQNVYRGGLLADEMGLGKTIMVLAALNICRHRMEDVGRDSKPVLAVMPVSLLENWKQELDKVFRTVPFKGCSHTAGRSRPLEIPPRGRHA